MPDIVLANRMAALFDFEPISCQWHKWHDDRTQPCRAKPYRHMFNINGVYSGTFCKVHTEYMHRRLNRIPDGGRRLVDKPDEEAD